MSEFGWIYVETDNHACRGLDEATLFLQLTLSFESTYWGELYPLEPLITEFKL